MPPANINVMTFDAVELLQEQLAVACKRAELWKALATEREKLLAEHRQGRLLPAGNVMAEIRRLKAELGED